MTDEPFKVDLYNSSYQGFTCGKHLLHNKFSKCIFPGPTVKVYLDTIHTVTIPLTIKATIFGLDLYSYQTKLLIQALNATQVHKRSYPTSY